MKRKTLTVAGLLGAALLGGCCSVDISRVGSTDDTHVLVRNYGWSLFDCIPLVCGSATPEETRIGPIAFFRDDVTVDKVKARFTYEAKKHGSDIRGLTYHNYDTIMFYLPILGIPLPIPYVLCYHEVQLSGVVK